LIWSVCDSFRGRRLVGIRRAGRLSVVQHPGFFFARLASRPDGSTRLFHFCSLTAAASRILRKRIRATGFHSGPSGSLVQSCFGPLFMRPASQRLSRLSARHESKPTRQLDAFSDSGHHPMTVSVGWWPVCLVSFMAPSHAARQPALAPRLGSKAVGRQLGEAKGPGGRVAALARLYMVENPATACRERIQAL